MSKIRVAVIFGGKSNEHDVSVVSATHVIKSIPKDKYDVICIGITKKGHWMKYIGDVDDIASNRWEQHPDNVHAFSVLTLFTKALSLLVKTANIRM
jgi:D-alanine-D-alanine ligase